MRGRNFTKPGVRALIWLLVCGMATLSYAAPGRMGTVAVRTAPRLSLTIGKSVILQSDADVSRVSVAQPEIADFVLLSPRQIYVTGRAPGITNLTLWDKGDKVRAVYDLDVAPDISRLKKMLHDVMPGESGIEVMSSQDSIALSGTVRDSANMKKALALAEVYAPKKVLNLLSVGGVQQVMLEVRVAEMSKSLVNRMGINLNAVGDGNFAYTLIGSLSSVASGMFDTYYPQNAYQYITMTANSGDGNSSFDSTPIQLAYREFNQPSSKATMSFNQGTAVARWNTNFGGAGNTAMTAVVDMLKQNGLVKILAEPNLVCLNGQSADFLAGGQIPVPVSSGLGTTSIEWKKFGVQLNFTPTVVAGDRINLKVNPEVSNLDYTRAITLLGSTVPAINTRQTSTTIELKNGQTFAIAGMLNEQSRDSMDKYPVLGDIPVLGALFKSSQYQKDQTELVILITAHLVKPLDKKAISLPTDSAHEPDDLEFFLGISRDAKSDAGAAQGQSLSTPAALDGDFGHAVPVAAVARPKEMQ
ncbi:type II and III secretion system protein [Solidesulfovibrio fructosivorans JJ]]|uniref:Type II and III secretion system protein n=1 Tax=Solidesulfovibrio fructosivorans JJ] TaxID=596151 RepID=E1JZJ2_SOLFR|nr:type II and III secretion system protein family protein [Solidesulfovibrio fructosivorans]EFL50239.1 type II and III secretion system protein [Solidesulfovibrio fructosivorans JJ]]